MFLSVVEAQKILLKSFFIKDSSASLSPLPLSPSSISPLLPMPPPNVCSGGHVSGLERRLC